MQQAIDLLPDSPEQWKPKGREYVLSALAKLQTMVKAGLLGGAEMPEDVHPQLDKSSKEHYHYFTLTMALNYQRNSYALWRAATSTFQDAETADVFDPVAVKRMSDDELQNKLLKYKLALQRNKHPEIWRRLCAGFVELFDGDVRNLFAHTGGDVGLILDHVQKKEKRHFPYLSGPKICHYWLYVMEQYTDTKLVAREKISVAPDTHVVKATCQLGLISPEVSTSANAQSETTKAWETILDGSGIQPIDVHTRLWLWSRAGFPKPIDASII